VVTALGKSTSEGRLSIDEFEERVGSVYAAKTYGDLEALLHDLPNDTATALAHLAPPLPQATQPATLPPLASHGGRRRKRRRPWHGWRSYVQFNALVWAIWGVSVVTSGHHNLNDLWPLWVSVPWGVVKIFDQGGRKHELDANAAPGLGPGGSAH
jgi:hypothetical protein